MIILLSIEWQYSTNIFNYHHHLDTMRTSLHVSLVHCSIHTTAEHVRQSSLDQDMIQKLEKQIHDRPAKDELVERNILKGRLDYLLWRVIRIDIVPDDKGISPALIAVKEKLQRSQLEVRDLSHPNQ